MIVDAGHFKRFNDRYGHQVGDEVLQGLARRLSASVHRPHDLVCRVGGEEFAILLTTPAFAQVIETPTSTTVIVPLGAPGVVTRQPGSTGEEGAATYSPSGRRHLRGGSAAAGNAGQPSRIGSTGSGGGGSGNGGGG